MVSPGSALLSPRGRVLEQGMPRCRLAEGVFDEEDAGPRGGRAPRRSRRFAHYGDAVDVRGDLLGGAPDTGRHGNS
jgi:phospholipase/carboxylesterase